MPSVHTTGRAEASCPHTVLPSALHDCRWTLCHETSGRTRQQRGRSRPRLQLRAPRKRSRPPAQHRPWRLQHPPQGDSHCPQVQAQARGAACDHCDSHRLWEQPDHPVMQMTPAPTETLQAAAAPACGRRCSGCQLQAMSFGSASRVPRRGASGQVLSSHRALCPAWCLRVSTSSLWQGGSLLHGRSLQEAHIQATQRERCLRLIRCQASWE